MTLSSLLQTYRTEHNLSQRQFALMCGLSNGYISMLERGENPKTKQPVTPTLPALKKLASGMGRTLSDMLSDVDDMPVDLLPEDTHKNIPIFSEEDGRVKEFIHLFDQLSADQQDLIIAQIRGILTPR